MEELDFPSSENATTEYHAPTQESEFNPTQDFAGPQSQSQPQDEWTFLWGKMVPSLTTCPHIDFVLGKDSYIIGRSRRSDVTIENPHVSTRHAVVSRRRVGNTTRFTVVIEDKR